MIHAEGAMTSQEPFSPETCREMTKLGFVTVKDRNGAMSFVPRDRVKEGVAKGWFTMVEPPK
jgi:hypothetical protein